MPKVGAFWNPKSGVADFMSGNLDRETLAKALAGDGPHELTPDGKGIRVFLKRSKSENPKAPAWELHLSTPREATWNGPQRQPTVPAAPAASAKATQEAEELPF